MFRELLNFLRSTDPLRPMHDDLLGMIDASHRMFSLAWQQAMEGAPSPQVVAEIRGMDVEVNKRERSVRRSVIDHLVSHQSVQLPACLALMSVVKDAERLGDYCKQIVKAAQKQDKGLSQSTAKAEFEAAAAQVATLFEDTRRAISHTDVALAKNVMLSERTLRKQCDALLDSLLGQDLPPRQAVPWALQTRHLRRLAAHLSNIASSLVMPLDRIDYHDEDFLK